MLKNTFQHIQGIGPVIEKQIWSAGFLDWETFEKSDRSDLVLRNCENVSEIMRKSIIELNNGNPNFFSDRLPTKEHWRLFSEFRKETAYIDIETNGAVQWEFMEITTIALYDGNDIRYYVQGQNLDEFITDISAYKVIVTYNGKTFDVPIIEKHFNQKLRHAHIDLRYVLKNLGFSGGLKRCEKALGIDRKELDGVDGFFAVLLWMEYQKYNNLKALETLLAYNIEDVVNLETLMVAAYNRKIQETPFAATHEMQLPDHPEFPLKPDSATIQKIKNQMARYDYFYDH